MHKTLGPTKTHNCWFSTLVKEIRCWAARNKLENHYHGPSVWLPNVHLVIHPNVPSKYNVTISQTTTNIFTLFLKWSMQKLPSCCIPLQVQSLWMVAIPHLDVTQHLLKNLCHMGYTIGLPNIHIPRDEPPFLSLFTSSQFHLSKVSLAICFTLTAVMMDGKLWVDSWPFHTNKTYQGIVSGLYLQGSWAVVSSLTY